MCSNYEGYLQTDLSEKYIAKDYILGQLGRSVRANSEARSPPCPSYTAKKLQPPGMRSRAKHRSSCDGRRPWIDDEPNHDDDRPAACATLLARIGVKPMAERGAGTAR